MNKDTGVNNWEKLNNLLFTTEKELLKNADNPDWPVFFVIGPPRSGTTLMGQSLMTSSVFAYISNFLAKFWKAPILGAKIESFLDLRKKKNSSSFQSTYGRTEGLLEPHEFGYFWDRWFDRGQSTHSLTKNELTNIDETKLKKSVGGIEQEFQLPVLFLNNTWCTYQMSYLDDIFQLPFFIICTRRPLYCSQSMLQGRKELKGNKKKWWSMKPKQYLELKKLPWWEQISGQIYYTVEEIQKAVEHISPERYKEVPYETFCRNPHDIIHSILEKSKLNKKFSPDLEQIPKKFSSTNNQKVTDEEFSRLQEGLKKFFGEEDPEISI